MQNQLMLFGNKDTILSIILKILNSKSFFNSKNNLTTYWLQKKIREKDAKKRFLRWNSYKNAYQLYIGDFLVEVQK